MSALRVRLLLSCLAVVLGSISLTTLPASALVPTTTTVTVVPHPSLTGWLLVTPTISHAGGPITKGECSIYIDDVWVTSNLNCLGQAILAPAPGTHTVRVDYLPDPFGIESDRDKYAPSSGTASYTVPSPPVATPPPVVAPPAGPVTTVAQVVTAKKSIQKKKRSFAITVAGADGSAPSGIVFLVITGPQKVTQKLTLTTGRAVTSVVLKKAGNYTAVAKVTSAPTHEGSKSPAVRFKVVEPKS